MKIERIEDLDGNLLAMIVRANSVEDGVNFVTNPDDGMQVGFVRYKSMHVIEPHRHSPRNPIQATCTEVLAVRHGRVQVHFYPVHLLSPVYCQSRILAPGDVLIQLAGGHGFMMLEDVEMMEVKTGPYFGKDADKEPI